MYAVTNESGNDKTGLGFRLVIDKRRDGVDNIRSLVLFLNQRGKLKGNKAGFRVIDEHGEPISNKFTWKNIHSEFKEDPATYKIFMQTAKKELETLISRAYDVEPIQPFSVDNILNDLE